MFTKNLLKFIFASIILILFSCGTEEEVVPDTLTITVSSPEIYLGNPINFSAVSQNNGTVTSTAQFFVNGEQIEGSTFTPIEENEQNTVYAVWNGMTSNTLTFSSIEEIVLPDTYTKKVLVEDYTGTWCGYCPE